MPRERTSDPLAELATDPLASAAIAVWQGDLAPLARLLRLSGRVVEETRPGEIVWADDDPRPNGGVVAGTDPISALAVAIFALYGDRWFEVPAGMRAWARTLAAWKAIARAAKQRQEMTAWQHRG